MARFSGISRVNIECPNVHAHDLPRNSPECGLSAPPSRACEHTLGLCKLLTMDETDKEFMRAIHEELQETNKLLFGISGFIGNITLWGLLAAVLYAVGIQVAPGFFLTASALVAFLGVIMALSALYSSSNRSRSNPTENGELDTSRRPQRVSHRAPLTCSCTLWERGFRNTHYRNGVEYCGRCRGAVQPKP